MALKILLVHNFYRHRGGEDQVVENELALLKEYGHEVQPLFFYSKDISPFGQFVTAWQLPNNPNAAARFEEKCASFNPDLIHVHNFFPLATTAIHKKAWELKIPVVQTFHNFRITCINGLLFRDGEPCQKCIRNNGLPGVLHRCYQNSAFASIAMNRMNRLNEKIWSQYVSQFIVLSDFAKDLFTKSGLPENKIHVKPNFSDLDTGIQSNDFADFNSRNYGLYLGRLSHEKGILRLLEVWSQKINLPLKVAGDGPLLDQIKQRFKEFSQIQILGQQSRENAMRLISNAKFVIVPSLCYENFPAVISESMLRGTPIIGANIGSIPEILQKGKIGYLYNTKNSSELEQIIGTICSANNNLQVIAQAAKKYAKDNFSKEANHKMLMNVYTKALESEYKS